MSEAERKKWDARYAAGAYANRASPTRLLSDWLPRMPLGRALDVACGAGRNALFLAQSGFEVDAVDISNVALDRGRDSARKLGVTVKFSEADLDASTPQIPNGPYDLILLVRYVNFSAYPLLISRLAPGGYIISEQHLICEDSVIGPKNPNFRVPSNALRRACRNLNEAFYYEGFIDDPDGRRAAIAQIVARKPDADFDTTELRPA